MGETDQATESLSKALILDPDSVSATIHLARLFLAPVDEKHPPRPIADDADLDDNSEISETDSALREGIDITVGMLDSLVRRSLGWNVPEAWYFLGKASGLQGRKEKQRECLREALRLDEGRPVRSHDVALPRCL
jgi:tetratricopeptide (TPR) repeat protein